MVSQIGHRKSGLCYPQEYGNWFLRTTNTKRGYQLATIAIKIVSLVSTIGWSVFMMAKPLVFRAHQMIAIHKWISVESFGNGTGRTWRYQQRWIWLAHGNTPPNLGMDQNVVLSKEQDGLGRRSEDGGQQPQQISAIGYDYVSAMGFSTFLKPLRLIISSTLWYFFGGGTWASYI